MPPCQLTTQRGGVSRSLSCLYGQQPLVMCQHPSTISISIKYKRVVTTSSVGYEDQTIHISYQYIFFWNSRHLCCSFKASNLRAESTWHLGLVCFGLGRMTDMQTAANNMKAQAWIGTSNNTHASYIIHLGKL